MSVEIAVIRATVNTDLKHISIIAGKKIRKCSKYQMFNFQNKIHLLFHILNPLFDQLIKASIDRSASFRSALGPEPQYVGELSFPSNHSLR